MYARHCFPASINNGRKAPTSKSLALPQKFPLLRHKIFTSRHKQRPIRAPSTNALLGTKSQSDTLSLPIDFYALLQVSRGVSRDTVSRAYEKCLSNPPNIGYSAQAINAREVVLRGALETLASPVTRREYDERLAFGVTSEEVPSDFVAGTLMLLQETGDHQTVIASGESWLSTHRRHRSARDVALATALAHCDLAQLRLDAQGSAREAVAMFDVAAKLLKQYRAGTPEFLGKIEMASKSLQPQLALEILSQPDLDRAGRARGLSYLPDVLSALAERAVSEGRRGESARRQYLDALRDVLTAEEHIELYAVAGEAYAKSPAEIYALAVAHIAAGCAKGDAQLIQRAADMLASAEKAALDMVESASLTGEETRALVRDRRSIEEKQRRAVASCVALLLLGDSPAAGAALGLNDGRLKCDRQVLAFIKANSPDPQMLLPGVCALATRWVSDVALTTFRTATAPSSSPPPASFSLDAWFENPRVIKYLEVSSGDKADGLPPFARMMKSLVAAPLAAIAGLFIVRDVPVSAPEAVGSDAMLGVAEAESKQQPAVTTTTAAAAALVVEEKKAPAIQKNEEHNQNEKQASLRVEELPPIARAVIRNPLKEQKEKTQEQEEQREQKTSSAKSPLATDYTTDNSNRNQSDLFFDTTIEDEDEFLTQPVALETIKPLVGEDDWMRKAYEARQIRWGRLVGASAVVLGGLVMATKTYVAPLVVQATTKPATLAAASTSTAATGKALLSRGEASSLINKWQHIKAKALGPRHELDALSSILQGDLLQQWQERASQLSARGLHYSHDLQSCNVVSVVARGATAQDITVNFKENIKVFASDGTEPQSFTSDYQVVYTVVKNVSSNNNNNNNWMITRAHVQTTQ